MAPRQFAIDQLDEAKVVTWAIHPPDLDAQIEAAEAAGYHYHYPIPDLPSPALAKRASDASS